MTQLTAPFLPSASAATVEKSHTSPALVFNPTYFFSISSAIPSSSVMLRSSLSDLIPISSSEVGGAGNLSMSSVHAPTVTAVAVLLGSQSKKIASPASCISHETAVISDQASVSMGSSPPVSSFLSDIPRISGSVEADACAFTMNQLASPALPCSSIPMVPKSHTCPYSVGAET